jgi:chemotaxis regulatin CheY-phosphate phosphatase CheZ
LPALSGPAIRSSADTVSSQAEVDSLLESLGF